MPEPRSTFRADIAALFGKYLPINGIHCDLVGMPGVHAALDVQACSANRKPALNVLRRLKKSTAYWTTIIAKLSTVNKANCDLLQVRDFVSVGLFVLCVARLKGIPFSYWMSFLMSEGRIEHAQAELKQQLSLYYCLVLLKGVTERFLLYRVVLRGASHVFVQSTAMAEYVQSKGMRPGKITAVPMGVDMEQFATLNAAHRQRAEFLSEPVIVYLGTLIKSRSIETLIDVLALVRLRYPQARLQLIGSSDTAGGNASLLRYARQKNVQDGVEITGWLPTQDAWKLLVRAAAALSYVPRNLFHDVSSPTKLLEYLAAGIPCVANDIPDQVTVLTQSRAGWLVAGSAEAMAQALIEILDNPQQAFERAGAGPGYILAQRSYAVIAQTVGKAYRRIIQEPEALQ